MLGRKGFKGIFPAFSLETSRQFGIDPEASTLKDTDDEIHHARDRYRSLDQRI
jgi:hypothetical protein